MLIAWWRALYQGCSMLYVTQLSYFAKVFSMGSSAPTPVLAAVFALSQPYTMGAPGAVPREMLYGGHRKRPPRLHCSVECTKGLHSLCHAAFSIVPAVFSRLKCSGTLDSVTPPWDSLTPTLHPRAELWAGSSHSVQSQTLKQKTGSSSQVVCAAFSLPWQGERSLMCSAYGALLAAGEELLSL